MKQIDTKFAVENVMCCAIAEWFETGHVPLYKYPEEFHEAIWSQGAIGWRQVFNGRISKLWLEHQGNTKINVIRTSLDGLYMGSINRRDLSSYDD